MKRAIALLVLAAMPAAAVMVAPACSSTPMVMPEASIPDDAGWDALHPPPINRTDTEAVLEPKRKACGFTAGAWPAETIGKELPVGSDMPINHVIVIMQENRSFDNYLGRLVAQGYYQLGEVDVPAPGWSNPDGDGGTVTPHLDDSFCYGVNHGWSEMHFDWDNGKNDGFVLNNNPNGQRAFYYEDDTIIPFYYALASTFGIDDRYFCSVLTSTWPNRMYLMAATSYGVGDNSFVTTDTVDHPAVTVFSLLDQAGRSWKDYTDGPHQVSFYPYYGLSKSTFAHFGNVKCDLMNDIKNGTLPDVSFMMGDEIDEWSDEGPSDLPGIGGLLVEQIVRALFASPSWKDTALFITYDENGGFADHVPPETACVPDSLPPHDENMKALPGAFDHTGFRVPFIAVSPFAKKHFVSHVVHDHAAITRFIEARFGLPAISARDANATPPYEMFDFQNPPFVTPPDIKATTTVDPAVIQRCNQKLAPIGCN
jgi:phospholipase C